MSPSLVSVHQTLPTEQHMEPLWTGAAGVVFVFVLAALGFELRVSGLLGRHSYLLHQPSLCVLRCIWNPVSSRSQLHRQFRPFFPQGHG
jgi:hypothetical protein